MIRSLLRTPHSLKSYFEDIDGSLLESRRLRSSLISLIILTDPDEVIMNVLRWSDFIWLIYEELRFWTHAPTDRVTYRDDAHLKIIFQDAFDQFVNMLDEYYKNVSHQQISSHIRDYIIFIFFSSVSLSIPVNLMIYEIRPYFLTCECKTSFCPDILIPIYSALQITLKIWLMYIKNSY